MNVDWRAYMEQNDSESLSIPSGLKTHTELFDGYGKDELGGTVIASIIGGLVDVLIYLLTGSTPFCIIFILLVVAGSIMMLMKDGSMNLSVMDQLRFMLRFCKCCKYYPYRYLDEWNIERHD